MARDWLLPAEVARLLHVSPKTISRWAREGKIKPSAVTFGRHRRFNKAEIEALAAQMEEKSHE